MKTLIFGIGNTLISDDGIGIKVAEEIEKRLNGNDDIEIRYGSIAGLSILDEIDGYNDLVLIDSIKTENGEPGQLYKLDVKDFNTTSHLSHSHGIDFFTAIEVGKKFGYQIPEKITVYAIEIADNLTIEEKISPEVCKNIPHIVETIIEGLKKVKHIS